MRRLRKEGFGIDGRISVDGRWTAPLERFQNTLKRVSNFYGLDSTLRVNTLGDGLKLWFSWL